MTTTGWFKVTFPKSEITSRITWVSMQMLQDINRHDACTLTFTSFKSSFSDTLNPGTPVTVSYGSRGRRALFVGTIAKVSPSRKVDGYFEHTITCVAASRQLRDTARTTWRNKTCPEVVTDIGTRLGFKVVTVQHSLRKATITQAGGSYWNLLTELSKICGYALRVEGTTIYFLPLVNMIKIFRSTAPRFAFSQTKNTSRLSQFTPTIGNTSDDPDDIADSATVTAFGPSASEYSDVTEYPSSAVRARKRRLSKFDRSNPHIVAYTKAEARALAKGMADRGQMAFDALLSGSGAPGMAPYHPVWVDSGSSETSGWWITKSARHYICNGAYTVEGIVSTDEVSDQYASPPPDVPFRDYNMELSFNLQVDGSILDIPQENLVLGNTFTSDSSYSNWVSPSPGRTLTPNTGLLGDTIGSTGTTYPSLFTYPSALLYPTT